MIKKYNHLSKEDKLSVMKFLKNGDGDFIENLKAKHSHADLISILYPMAFENPITEHECELVTLNVSKGMMFGYYMEQNQAMLVFIPMIEEQRLDVGLVFPKDDTIQKTTLDFPMYWTTDLWIDTLLLQSILKHRKETVINMIKLIDFDMENSLPN